MDCSPHKNKNNFSCVHGLNGNSTESALQAFFFPKQTWRYANRTKLTPMIKFVNTDVVFQEIPDEVTLAINISNCPFHCPGCHSKYLWADVGTELTEAQIDGFIEEFGNDITCLCFMGGDAEPEYVDFLASYIRVKHPSFKVGWYTGRTILTSKIDKVNFDYIKVGPYIAHLGPLKNPKTNQRLYKINRETQEMENITSRFWKK